jgi:hypothetical protein
MKKAIVIGTFPTDKTTERMLTSCIRMVKAFEWDIVLVSHKSLPQHIIDMVDYYIYDKENILEPIDLTPVYWYHSDLFSVQINGCGHIVPVTRNMKNGIGLLDVLGYKFFYYMESDNLLSREDVFKLEAFAASMSAADEQMILFKIGEGDGARYESLMFGGRPSFFMKVAQLPMKSDDLRKYNVHPTLEDVFYASFRYHEHECFIINKSSSHVLSTSSINLIANHHKAEIIRDHDEERYFLWISNSPDNPASINVSINGSDNMVIPPNGYYYQPVEMSQIIRVEITEGVQTKSKVFFVTEADLPQFRETGYIKFNK